MCIHGMTSIILRTTVSLLTAAGLVAAVGMATATATEPTTRLDIDPIGYMIVNGKQDLAHPIEKPEITQDPGYSSTTSSNGSYRGPRSVIGTDDRTQVTETRASPYRRTGQITFTSNAKSYICTGWLISPNAVVTAGHCLADDSSDITFSPGRNGENNPFGTYQATEVWYDKNFGTEGRDWGLIKLDRPVGDVVGWYAIEPVDGKNLVGRDAHIIGYPGDKPYGTMWQDTNAISRQEPRNLHYSTDTAGGQSGSAVTSTNDDIAHGIHVTGDGTFNGATALTAELFNTLGNLRY